MLGIDIRDAEIAVADVRRGRRGAIFVRAVGLAPGPGDGNPRETVAAIKALWRDTRLAGFTVCSALRARSLALKPFALSGVSATEMAPALRLEAEAMLQLAPDDIVMDWHVDPAARRPGSEVAAGTAACAGILAAAPRTEVEEHLSLLRRAGLYPVVLDLGALAVCNLYLAARGPVQADGGGICLVSLAARSADIAVLADTRCVYARSAFSRSGPWEDGMDYLVESVGDVLKYCRYKLRRNPALLVLTGRLPDGLGVSDRLGGELGVPAQVWNPFADKTVRCSSGVRTLCGRDDVGMKFAACLGLGLREC